MRHWFVGLLALAAAEAQPVGTLIPAQRVDSTEVTSPIVTVWLPPGYAQSHARYPVLYMQDGQNVFDAAIERSGSPGRQVWGADTVASRLIVEGRIRPIIIVGIDNQGINRPRQYYPQRAFDRLTLQLQQQVSAQFGGAPYSDAYLRFLVRELKPEIDRAYRTEPGPRSTFVMGSSMGGLISLYAVTEYPEVFGGAACLSTHWMMALPGSGAAPSEPLFGAMEAYLRDKHPAPARLWFDHGTKGLDAGYGPYQARIDALLTSQGWKNGPDFASKVYFGADHTETDWRARLADSLTYLFGQH